jgi:hypothetical protein
MVVHPAAEKGDFDSVRTILEGCRLVAVDGRPVYYLVNVTDRPDELLVTLCNNSHGMPWEGCVRVPGQQITEVEEWLAYGEVQIRDGVLHCGVPPNDVRVFRLRMRQPFLDLRFREIPWRELGVGTPEWPDRAPAR